jgi:hypothetical protein
MYGCEVWQMKEERKNCWLWKLTFCADQQEHPKEKILETK